MRVEVRLFATLREGRFKNEKMELQPHCRLRDLLAQLEISEQEASIRLINGVSRPLDSELTEHDVVSIFPPVGGG